MLSLFSSKKTQAPICPNLPDLSVPTGPCNEIWPTTRWSDFQGKPPGQHAKIYGIYCAQTDIDEDGSKHPIRSTWSDDQDLSRAAKAVLLPNPDLVSKLLPRKVVEDESAQDSQDSGFIIFLHRIQTPSQLKRYHGKLVAITGRLYSEMPNMNSKGEYITTLGAPYVIVSTITIVK